mmetsp:Transcript_30709/g.59242  ORF Transcript_30709/g.59242 Transcript_30709/m.59242 type:complete len:203 (+) Transcript_30709:657-1265(+)
MLLPALRPAFDPNNSFRAASDKCGPVRAPGVPGVRRGDAPTTPPVAVWPAPAPAPGLPPCTSLRLTRSRMGSAWMENKPGPAPPMSSGVSSISRRMGVLSSRPHVMKGDSSTPGAGEGDGTYANRPRGRVGVSSAHPGVAARRGVPIELSPPTREGVLAAELAADSAAMSAAWKRVLAAFVCFGGPLDSSASSLEVRGTLSW